MTEASQHPSRSLPCAVWHVISSGDLLAMLRRVAARARTPRWSIWRSTSTQTERKSMADSSAPAAGGMTVWEASMREDWQDSTPTELLDEIMRLRRGMDEVRSRHLHNHHAAAEDLHCWTWNGCEPNEWKPNPHAAKDEMAYQEQQVLNFRLRELASSSTRP